MLSVSLSKTFPSFLPTCSGTGAQEMDSNFAEVDSCACVCACVCVCDGEGRWRIG